MNAILNFRAGYPVHLSHLSDEQIDDHLIGDLAPEAATHLAGCSPCTRRVAEAEAMIANFRAVAMEWSDRRSATMPLQTAATHKPGWVQRFAFGAATAALLAVGFTVSTISTVHTSARTQAASPAPVQAVAQVEAVSETEAMAHPRMSRVKPVSQTSADDKAISRDNQMLQEIDVALSSSAASPASLGLETVSSEVSTPEQAPVLMQN